MDWKNLLKSVSGDIKRLDYVKRYGSVPVTVEETTATHSYWVSLYSIMIHKQLTHRSEPSQFERLLGPISVYAIIHDGAECITGDVIRLLKYATPSMKSEVDKAEAILIQKLDQETQSLFHICDHMLDDVSISYVKSIVKVADFISLFQYMNREAMRGNLEIYPFYMKMVEDFQQLELVKSEFRPSIESRVLFKPYELFPVLIHESNQIRRTCFHRIENLT